MSSLKQICPKKGKRSDLLRSGRLEAVSISTLLSTKIFLHGGTDVKLKLDPPWAHWGSHGFQRRSPWSQSQRISPGHPRGSTGLRKGPLGPWWDHLSCKICSVLTFIDGVMEAKLMETSTDKRQGEYRAICLCFAKWCWRWRNAVLVIWKMGT